MPRNVLYVNTPGILGGSEISLLLLMQYLSRHEFSPVLATTPHSAIGSEAKSLGIRVVEQEFQWYRRSRPWHYWKSIYGLVAAVRKHNIALIHTNCDHSLPYVSRVTRITGVPYVSHIRDFVRAWFRSPYLDALMNASAVIANSHAIAERSVQAGIPAANVRVIRNPVDVRRFARSRADRQAFRNTLTLPPETYIIGIVGQIQDIKGHEDFVVAARSIAAEFPSTLFLIVGEAFTSESIAFKERLNQQIEEYSMSHQFRFLGFRRDVERILPSLDVLVVPSWDESFGRIVVEGMASGCPVVGTNVGGIPEILRDEDCGLLIPAHSPRHIAEAVIRILQNPALRASLIESGLDVARGFDAAGHARHVESLYRDSLRLDF